MSLSLFSLVACGSAERGLQPQEIFAIRTSPNTSWMSGKYGISTHYFANTPAQLNSRANGFNARNIAEQTARAGASWFLLPLYHQPWLMNAPNKTYESLLHHRGYSMDRDLPMDLEEALAPKSIRLMLYVNLRVDSKSVMPKDTRKALGLQGYTPNDPFVHSVSAIYREFSIRYARRVSGWVIDGVQGWAKINVAQRERWFSEIATALRAGNPDALVAFNPGLKIVRYSAQSDFSVGESKDLSPLLPLGRFTQGFRWHMWTYLGDYWGRSGTRFTNAELLKHTQDVIRKAGAVTYEVGVEKDGSIDPIQIKQLSYISEHLKAFSNAAQFFRNHLQSFHSMGLSSVE